MRDIPGVYVGGTNGMNQKIYMRGVSDRGLNITIDGAKQNGNTFHHNADLLIDPDLIKAVDVEVGSRSVVNGSGALGGSVAFKTVDAKDLLESGEIIGAKIKTGYASNNSEFSQGLMLFTAPVEGLDFIAAINHKGYDYGKSGNKRKIGGDGNDLSYLLKLGYSFLDAHRISISREHNEFKGIYPLKAEFGSDHSGDKPRKYERDTTTLKYEYKPSDLLNLDVTAYNARHQRIDGSKWGVKTNGINAKAKSVVETGALTQTLRYGAEFYQSKNFNKPNNHYPEKVNNYSIYAEDALNFNSLTVTPGIRYTRHELKSYDGRAGNVKSYTYKFNEFTPALALDYEILKGLNAFASYARVFRGPDVMESMMASGRGRSGALNWAANKDLKATTGNSYETGLKYQGDISEASSYSLSAKYFMTKYKNLIVDNNAAGGGVNQTLVRINAGGADISGVELLARLNLDALSLAASYTHQKVKYKDRVAKPNGTYYTSNIIGYRDQGDKYTFNAEYAFSSIDTLIGYNLIYFASKNTISAGDNENVKISSYAVSDIYATYAPSSGKFKGLEINAGIYNLFNKAYASQSQRTADYTGDPNYVDWEPGRNFKVNISYKF
ncbi:TonB-dependent receptor domain-containing protein [Campylobacter concisus]|uniref:TonB-dependent receptor domain-containing protein n=1 Tax=Campylobacter concisus TaxID=199 RepID=UPI00214D91C4|nr:TonB-dependent receptor [Campylobacter concisus]